MKNETGLTRITINSDCIEDDIETQYPTDAEMEAMYEEFLKSESLHEFFDDDPF